MSASLVVGVTKLAWMYGKSRDWAEKLLEQWFEEDRAIGRTPPRVFESGKRGSLFTTLAVVNQVLPPGRDPVLYRRMKDVEEGLTETGRRLDREIEERKREDQGIRQRVAVVENAVRRRAS